MTKRIDPDRLALACALATVVPQDIGNRAAWAGEVVADADHLLRELRATQSPQDSELPSPSSPQAGGGLPPGRAQTESCGPVSKPRPTIDHPEKSGTAVEALLKSSERTDFLRGYDFTQEQLEDGIFLVDGKWIPLDELYPAITAKDARIAELEKALKAAEAKTTVDAATVDRCAETMCRQDGGTARQCKIVHTAYRSHARACLRAVGLKVEGDK